VEEGSTICVAMIWWGVPFGLEAPDSNLTAGPTLRA
jgi:hypothetical protein